MAKFVIISYVNSDMDGISAIYMYLEYLNRCGKELCYYYERNKKRRVDSFSDVKKLLFN